MFSNLRFVSIVAFGILVVMTLFAGIYFKHASVENVVKTAASEQSEILAETFTATVWNRYYPVINHIATQPKKEWDTYAQFLAFKEDSKDLFFPDNLVKVVVHGKNDEILLDSKDSINLEERQGILKSIIDKNHVKDALKEAKEGKKSSVIMPNTFVKTKEQEDKKAILKSFIPISVTEVKKGFEDQAKKANAIMEVNYDITPTMKRLEVIQFTSVFLIICALGILTGSVFIASQKAESVIEEQQEASMEMASAKASAEAENKAKSQFLANISHELRTPLNAIIGFSEIINSESMGPLNNEQYKEFVKDIHTSGVHLLSLINDILDFSKAEENKLDVTLEEVDVTKLVKISMRMVMPRAEEAKVKLTEEVPPEHLILMADSKRLKQVILNLLSNAVKFTPEAGEVAVRVWKDEDGSYMYFEVRDTGVGMEAQDLAKALSPFGQVDSKLSRRYEGTGLGLPLTKKLVELMKGKFDIKSEVGLGTTITLSFPLHSSEGSPTSTEEQPSGTPVTETVATPAVAAEPQPSLSEQQPIETTQPAEPGLPAGEPPAIITDATPKETSATPAPGDLPEGEPPVIAPDPNKSE